MNKLYTRIVWENFPSEKTALNESNLNRMDLAIDNIDNRVIEMDSTKVNKEVANNLVKTWSIDESTGIITVTHLDGSKDIFDLNIEKIPVNFELSDDGILTMTTDDGTQYTANIGAMIPVLTFEDSDEIAVSATGTGVNKTYSFSIKAGSVTEDKLQPNFLADVKTEVAKAQASQSAAAQSASAASNSATLAESYTHGGTGAREGEDTDNAKYWAEQAKSVSSVEIATIEKVGIVKPDGTTITIDEDGTIHGQSKVSEMTGATAEADGTSGTVPAPLAGQENHVLKGNGTWEPLVYDSELSAESENAPQTKVVEARAREIETNLAQLSNPNLLINPDFRINQRGGKIVESGKNYYSDESCGTLVSTTTSVYTATKISNGNYSISIDSTAYYIKASDVVDGYCAAEYTVDRWFNTEGTNQTNKVVDNGLSLINNGGNYCQIRYIFENMLANRKTYTVSMKINDNQILSGSFSYDKDNGNIFNLNGGSGYTVFISASAPNQLLYIRSTNNVIINWVKLELGSVATPFVPPDPATELLKCQRYYQKLGRGLRAFTRKPWEMMFTGELPTTMRTIPSVSLLVNAIGAWCGTNSSSDAYYVANPVTFNGAAVSESSIQWISTTGFSNMEVGVPCHTANTEDLFAFDAEIY